MTHYRIEFYRYLRFKGLGFEPTTPSPPAKCATRLRHAPTFLFHKYNLQKYVNIFLRQ